MLLLLLLFFAIIVVVVAILPTEGGAMPRRGLGVFDRRRCSVEWEHCLSAGIRNPQVTYDDEDGNDYADNGDDQVIRDRRERSAGL